MKAKKQATPMFRSLITIEPERAREKDAVELSRTIFLYSDFSPAEGSRIRPFKKDWFVIRKVFSSKETKLPPEFGDVLHFNPKK